MFYSFFISLDIRKFFDSINLTFYFIVYATMPTYFQTVERPYELSKANGFIMIYDIKL